MTPLLSVTPEVTQQVSVSWNRRPFSWSMTFIHPKFEAISPGFGSHERKVYTMEKDSYTKGPFHLSRNVKGWSLE